MLINIPNGECIATSEVRTELDESRDFIIDVGRILTVETHVGSYNSDISTSVYHYTFAIFYNIYVCFFK